MRSSPAVGRFVEAYFPGPEQLVMCFQYLDISLYSFTEMVQGLAVPVCPSLGDVVVFAGADQGRTCSSLHFHGSPRTV